ncbi:hypothetical protein [Ornithinimicrobium kibberense]|uniref:hypothetical protein n=1 Tax=Ornithinimicrobium kibberense TaxID=282060 RepID=UPI003622A061
MRSPSTKSSWVVPMSATRATAATPSSPASCPTSSSVSTGPLTRTAAPLACQAAASAPRVTVVSSTALTRAMVVPRTTARVGTNPPAGSRRARAAPRKGVRLRRPRSTRVRAASGTG